MNRVFSAISTKTRHAGRLATASAVFTVFVLTFSSWGAGAVVAEEREVISPSELDQIGLVQAWRRHLSVPSGIDSIVDHTIFVHSDSPKQYVEVVGVAKKVAGTQTGERRVAATSGVPADESLASAFEASTAAEETPQTPLYGRYLLEVPDVAESADSPEAAEAGGETAALTSKVMPSGRGSMLDRMTFGGRASFASSGLLDRAEAERRARNDIRRLKSRGIDAEIRFHEVPIIRMYTLAEDGTIESRDAETGEIVWMRRVGSRVRGYSGLGVDDRFLTIVNGGELIKLDVKDGGEFGVDRLRYVPMRGPRHCGGFAVIPSIGDRMVAYPLDDLQRDIHAEIVVGSSSALPTLAIGSQKIAWGTSEGYVYVMEEEGEPIIQFRLRTDGVVSAAIAAAAGNRFYFGAASGQIYGLRATHSGEVMWTRPTGDPIFDSPIVFGEKVLFRSAYGNLMCVDAGTGADAWGRLVSGIAEVISVIDEQIFAKSLSGSLIVLNTEDGSLTRQLPGMHPRILIPNIVSDRLYLVDRFGTIQCLRRPGADMPTLVSTQEEIVEEDEAEKNTSQLKTAAPAAAGNDPFSGGDPFGAGGADPFGGGGADPFAPAGGGDPFAPAGDESDPFGGF